MPKKKGKRKGPRKVRLPARIRCHRGKKPKSGLYMKKRIGGYLFYCRIRTKRPKTKKLYHGSLVPESIAAPNAPKVPVVIQPSYIA